MSRLDELLTKEQIAKVRAPLEEAYWLPNKAYTSPEFFQLEVDKLFSRTWMSVGFAADVRDIGDAYPTTILGDIPVVMVRDEKGALRVFHNVCPRDGCLAVWSPKKSLSRIVGAYHGWVWNLDGTLRDATRYDGSSRIQKVPQRDADLKEIRSAEWQETVFINLSGDAQPFEEYIAPVEELYSEIDLSNLTPGTSKDGSKVLIDRYTFESNWKSVYENFAINVNHEGFVHDDYKTAPNVPRVTPEGDRTYEEVDERGYHGLKFTEVESDLAYGLARTPRNLHKDGKEYDWNTIMTLYPNTDISLFPNFLLITVIMPQAPDSTEYDSIFLYPEEVAGNPKFFEQREVIMNRDWGHARNEDAAVLRVVQKGRKSPAYDQHFLVPFWESMSHGFCNRILDDLESD